MITNLAINWIFTDGFLSLSGIRLACLFSFFCNFLNGMKRHDSWCLFFSSLICFLSFPYFTKFLNWSSFCLRHFIKWSIWFYLFLTSSCCCLIKRLTVSGFWEIWVFLLLTSSSRLIGFGSIVVSIGNGTIGGKWLGSIYGSPWSWFVGDLAARPIWIYGSLSCEFRRCILLLLASELSSWLETKSGLISRSLCY